MSIGSIVVVVVLFALVGLAIWRGYKKGVPCSCGGSRKNCGCCCGDGPQKSQKSNVPHDP